jgi:hypothetical protein
MVATAKHITQGSFHVETYRGIGTDISLKLLPRCAFRALRQQIIDRSFSRSIHVVVVGRVVNVGDGRGLLLRQWEIPPRHGRSRPQNSSLIFFCVCRKDQGCDSIPSFIRGSLLSVE